MTWIHKVTFPPRGVNPDYERAFAQAGHSVTGVRRHGVTPLLWPRLFGGLPKCYNLTLRLAGEGPVSGPGASSAGALPRCGNIDRR